MISIRTGATIVGAGALVAGAAIALHHRRDNEHPEVPVDAYARQLVTNFDVRSTRGNGDGAVDVAREGVRSVYDKAVYDKSWGGAYGIVTEQTGAYYERTHAIVMWSDVDKAGRRDGRVTLDETTSWLSKRFDANGDRQLQSAEQSKLRREFPSAFDPGRELA